MKNALVSLEHHLMGKLRALDRALVAHGWPALSPWWLATFAMFVSAAVRQLVARVGRRGGKSSSLCRFAVAFALSYDMSQIPPGDVGIVGIVSVSRDEAQSRLRTIKQILDVLAVRWKPIDGGIELVDRAVVFKVFAASLGGVVGGTWILAICDELARWRDHDSGVNPASEVLASLRPTLATQPGGKIFLSSSPLGLLDAHHDAFEVGDNAFQRVVHAETWSANPTISEADTHALEPDEATWRREYAAIPQSEAETALYTAVEIDRATRKAPIDLPPEAGVTYEAAQDPATRGDSWAFCIAALRPVGDRVVRSVVLCREWKGTRVAPLDPRRVLAEIKALLEPYHVSQLWTDQASGDALVALGDSIGLSVCIEPTSVASKRDMFEDLKTHLGAGVVEIPPDPQVRADLLAVRKRITRAGVSLELPRIGGRHADYSPAIALVMTKLVADPLVTHKPTEQEAELARRKARFDFFAEQDNQRPRWMARGGGAPSAHRRFR